MFSVEEPLEKENSFTQKRGSSWKDYIVHNFVTK